MLEVTAARSRGTSSGRLERRYAPAAAVIDWSEQAREARALRVDAAETRRFCHAAHGHRVCALPHVHLETVRLSERIAESALHDAPQPLVDGLLLPEELLEILHPLEVRHRDAAGVSENVRQDHDPALVQDVVGLG